MLQKIKNRKPQAGFTLVELLIVIVVIAILAAIAISAFSNVQAQARDAQRQSDIETVQSNLELYYADNGFYPGPGATDGMTAGEDVVAGANGFLEGLDPEALHEPQDTAEGNSFGTDALSATTNAYRYQATQSDGSTACTTAAEDCQSYTLTYWSETADTPGVVNVEDISGE